MTTTATTPSTLPGDEVDRKGVRLGFINNKGGVGKSLMTAAVAQALAQKGRRVLMIDMEPQGNLTRRAGVAGNRVPLTISDALARNERGGAAEAIVRCGWDIPEAANIDVIAATSELSAREEEASQPGSHNRLRRILWGVTDAYDYTLIDCRPALMHLEQMVIGALDGDDDGYYLVVEAGHDEIAGAYRVMATVNGWAEQMDMTVRARGVLVNKYEGTKLHRGLTYSMPASLSIDGVSPPILKPYVRKSTRIATLTHFGRPLFGDPALTTQGHIKDLMDLADQVDR